MKSKILGLLTVVLLAGPMAAQAVVIHTTDFIDNASRTNFNGFEGAPASVSFGSTYTEDGVRVDQVNGQPNDIWTTCSSCFAVPSGVRSWYPNGGDFGWTEVTRADGSDFVDVGMSLGSGFGTDQGPVNLFYELLSNGQSVATGGLIYSNAAFQYLGFSGGGFDTIRLRTTQSAGGTFGDGQLNALALDDIELAGQPVPEPGTLALLGLGLAGLGLARRRRIQQVA